MRRDLKLKTGDEQPLEKRQQCTGTLEVLAYRVGRLPAHFIPVELDLHDRRVGHEHGQNCLGPGGTDVIPAKVQRLERAIGR